MASSNFYFDGDTSAVKARASVSEESASGNSRTIRLKLYAFTVDSFSGGRDGEYEIFCSEAGVDTGSRFTISKTETKIFDETFSVSVPAGSSEASINFSFSVTLISPSAGRKTITGGISRITDLSKSDPYINPYIVSTSDIYFGDRCSVTISARVDMYYRFIFNAGSFEVNSGIVDPGMGMSGNYTYTGTTIPLSAASNFPKSTSGTVKVTVYHYRDRYGNDLVGGATTNTFTATLRNDVIPKINSASISVNNSGSPTVSSWGVALSGFTKLHAIASATGVYGSTIESFILSGDYTDEIQGGSLNYVGDVIRSGGNKQLIIKCRDSRGRVSNEIRTNIIQFRQYDRPTISSFVMSKSPNKRFVATANWSYDTVDGKNQLSVRLDYKKTTTTDWTYYGTLSNNTPLELVNIIPDEYASYNFRVTITDSLGSVAQKDAFISTIQVLLDFRAGGKGLGIGKVCESDAMEVSMVAKFFDQVYIGSKTLSDYIRQEQIKLSVTDVGNMVYPVGSVYTSVNSTSPANIFGGKWERIEGRFLFAANNKYGLGKTGGEEYHTLTLEEMPSHRHNNVRRSEADHRSNASTGASEHNGISSHETDLAGGDQPHNNMPPFLSVYIWKRIG